MSETVFLIKEKGFSDAPVSWDTSHAYRESRARHQIPSHT